MLLCMSWTIQVQLSYKRTYMLVEVRCTKRRVHGTCLPLISNRIPSRFLLLKYRADVDACSIRKQQTFYMCLNSGQNSMGIFCLIFYSLTRNFALSFLYYKSVSSRFSSVSPLRRRRRPLIVFFFLYVFPLISS